MTGLKRINDDMGHAAGDELIKGAGIVIKDCFGEYGNSYRMGGDEFSVLFYGTKDELVKCIKAMEKRSSNYSGEIIKKISISYGYACWAEYRDKTVTEIEKMADADMYRNKSEYYKKTGLDRRR